VRLEENVLRLLEQQQEQADPICTHDIVVLNVINHLTDGKRSKERRKFNVIRRTDKKKPSRS
jgi:enhancing lycopene biosynthesis protein 2